MDVAFIFMCHVVCKNFSHCTYTSFKLCQQDRSGPDNADVCLSQV